MPGLAFVNLWVAACFCLSTSNVRAAEFALQPADFYGPVSVLIRGEIKAGDFGRFQDFLLQPGHLVAYANYIWLDSRGGDLPEAMKFANLLEKSTASVVVGPDGKCYSACFMMFAAGADRWLYAFGELGVHQVAVTSRELDRAQTTQISNAVASDLQLYLARMGIPAGLIDKMMNTPTSEIYKIDTLLLKRMGWGRRLASQSSFLAATEKACGVQTEADSPNSAELAKWKACRIDLQIKSTKAFAAAELALLDSAQPSLLFAPGKLPEARLAVRQLQ